MEPGTLGLEGRDLTTAPTPPLFNERGESYYRKKTILSSENTLHNFHTHNLLLKKWNIKISLQVLAILEILFTLQKSPDLIYEEKFLI